MSKETLEFHHDLLFEAYVDNGNKLISGTECNMTLEEIITKSYDPSAIAQSDIFNNASALEPHAVLGNDGSKPNEVTK